MNKFKIICTINKHNAQLRKMVEKGKWKGKGKRKNCFFGMKKIPLK